MQLGGPEELRTIGGPALARRLGYLPQRGSLEFGLPVRELVVMGRYRHHGLLSSYGPHDYALADAALGPLLRPQTRDALHHAGSRRDALTLLLSSPEFQRR